MIEKTDIYPYQIINGKKKKKVQEPKKSKPPRQKMDFNLAGVKNALTWDKLALYGISFFLGRAVLLGELMPFGLAFTAAACLIAGPLPGIPLAAALGLFSVAAGINLHGSLVALALIYILICSLRETPARPWLSVPAMAGAVLLITKTALVAFQRPSLYSYISILFEAIFSGVLTLAFIHALPPLINKGSRIKRPLTGEVLLCIVLLLGGLVAGTGGLQYQMISLRGVVSRGAVLLTALLGGPGLGAATGAVVGIIPGLSYTVTPGMIGAFSFAGLLAGACRGFGKLGVAVGFILGNIILTIYVNDYSSLTGILTESTLAAVIFMLIPVRWQEKLSDILPAFDIKTSSNHTVSVQDTRLKEITADRIKNWAKVFRELSASFDQVSTTVQQVQEEEGLQKLFDEVAKRVCDGCALYRTCWERDSYRTYQNMLDLLAVVEQQGQVTIEDLSDDLKKRCARLKEMAITITCLYETYKVNRYWQKKLLESRSLVSEQLNGVSRIMDNLSGELALDVELNGDMERTLLEHFEKIGIPIEEIYTLHHNGGQLEVGVVKPACRGEMECRYTVAPVVSRVVGRPLTVTNTQCQLHEEEGICGFKLYPALNYRLIIGVAKESKAGNGVSGDSYATLQLRQGKCCLLLSDGMGVGPKAALQSSTTVSLLENLLESGFEESLAIKTVNSILMLRSAEENFSTVDLTVIDLYKAEANIIKIGAVPGFLIRNGEVEVIQTNSLPAGILEDIDVASVTRQLVNGDIMIMVTDGILDAYGGPLAKEDWFSRVVQEGIGLAPQEMAEVLLQIAKSASGGQAKDDLTVVVAKIEALEN